VNNVIVANIFDVLVVFHLTVEFVVENIAQNNRIRWNTAQLAQCSLKVRDLRGNTPLDLELYAFLIFSNLPSQISRR
jgi:hypothetical protein